MAAKNSRNVFTTPQFHINDIDNHLQSSGITKEIGLSKENRTGAYMNYWSKNIGIYSNQIIPSALQQTLKNECVRLVKNKNKLDYRDKSLTNMGNEDDIQIQDIIEPCNTGTLSFYASNVDDNDNHVSKSSQKKEIKPLPNAAPFNNNWNKPPNQHQHGPISLTFDGPSMKPRPKDKDIDSYIPVLFKANDSLNGYHEIIGDIPDLPKTKDNQTMYKVIQDVFNKYKPYIHKIMNKYPYNTEKVGEHLGTYNRILIKESSDTNKNISTPDKPIIYPDEYYVVIKLTDYQFLSPKSKYQGGNYHSEGLEKEGINTVALYYFDVTSHVQGGGLSFTEQIYDHFGSSGAARVNIVDNSSVFFSNKSPLKHKVNPMCMPESKSYFTGYYKRDNIKVISQECQDKYGKKIYGTRKLLGFFILNKWYRGKSSRNIVVNFNKKAIYLISHWIRINLTDNKLGINNDVMCIMMSYICGDMKYIKKLVNNSRRKRYEYGKAKQEYDKSAFERHKYSMRGVCD